jgi:hypothetical protein
VRATRPLQFTAYFTRIVPGPPRASSQRINQKILGTISRDSASQVQVTWSASQRVRHLVAAPAALSKLPAGVALDEFSRLGSRYPWRP